MNGEPRGSEIRLVEALIRANFFVGPNRVYWAIWIRDVRHHDASAGFCWSDGKLQYIFSENCRFCGSPHYKNNLATTTPMATEWVKISMHALWLPLMTGVVFCQRARIPSIVCEHRMKNPCVSAQFQMCVMQYICMKNDLSEVLPSWYERRSLSTAGGRSC